MLDTYFSMEKQYLKRGFGLGGWLPKSLVTNGENDADVASYLAAPFESASDAYWMFQALLASMESIGIAAPNPAVGSVIVRQGKLLSTGATGAFGGPHAELVAINAAKAAGYKDLKGATCYVTLEPCCHHGKQPPCVDALLKSGIERVVVALADPYADVSGAGIAKLRANGVRVDLGVLAAECAAWHFPFLIEQVFGRPAVIGKWAQTLDGKLADDQASSKWITGPYARAHTHWLRQKYDAIMIGANTLLNDKPSLNVRDCQKPHHRNPLKLVFDPNARLLERPSTEQKTLVDRMRKDPGCYYGVQRHKITDQLRSLEDASFRVVELKAAQEDLVNEFITASCGLYKESFPQKRLQSIFVEGGPRLLNLLLYQGLLDAAHAFINPSFMGSNGYGIGKSTAEKSPACDQRLQWFHISAQTIGSDILCELLPKTHLQIWRKLIDSNS